MKKKCLIIDDEPLAIEIIKAHVSKIPNLEVVATCHNALEGFEVLKTQEVDLLFLDIQMPLLTGIEFIKSLSNPPKVIFTTAYREYAIESYELEAVDYLLKPISFDRFFKAVNNYFKRIETKTIVVSKETSSDDSSGHIFVNVNKKHHKILFNEIVYAESLKDYVCIHTLNGSITTKDKISDFEDKLPSCFLRSHRSYIVNLNMVTAFTSQDIELGNIEIPIGVSYKKSVMESLK
ncbi:DNA-binding response regulator [Flavobacteriales bacterium 34_180_T64]|nr:DNA-binding response regulator [Flavobacteriales bacterium 34_180_T64]